MSRRDGRLPEKIHRRREGENNVIWSDRSKVEYIYKYKVVLQWSLQQIDGTVVFFHPALKPIWVTTPMLNGMEWQWKHAGLERHWDLFSIFDFAVRGKLRLQPLKSNFPCRETNDRFLSKSQSMAEWTQGEEPERKTANNYFFFFSVWISLHAGESPGRAWQIWCL